MIKNMWRMRVGGVLLALVTGAVTLAAQAAQDGFVPVNRAAQVQETIPAATLVGVAYGFVWVMLLGYLWSIWSRLGKVERELEVVSRRVTGGGRQA